MSRILFVMSGADRWTLADGTTIPAGFFAEEVSAPHASFREAGHTIGFASPAGRAPTLDRVSLDPEVAGRNAPAAGEYVASIAADLYSPGRLDEVDIADWDAVVVPGGHAPCEDLYQDEALGRILVAAHRGDKVVASVCHGPAALLSAVDDDGTWAFEGRRLTCFTIEEEEQYGTAAGAPWLMETRLRELGGLVESGEPWAPFVVRDGRFITGQNPASSALMAEAVNDALR